MEAAFGPEWPNEEKIKRRDMVAPEARYIFVHQVSNEDADKVLEFGDVEQACSCKGSIVGFVHYRFTLEEEVPVLYVYELQLERRVQGKGLGKFLMQLIELIASQVRSHVTILAVIYFSYKKLVRLGMGVNGVGNGNEQKNVAWHGGIIPPQLLSFPKVRNDPFCMCVGGMGSCEPLLFPINCQNPP